MLSYHTILLLLFILNDPFIVSNFLCSPSVSGFWWCWGKQGEQRRKAKEKISVLKCFFMCGKTFTCVYLQLRFPTQYVKCFPVLQQTHALVANVTRNAFQGKRKETISSKNFKSARNVFNKEEVNYDNYSDW